MFKKIYHMLKKAKLVIENHDIRMKNKLNVRKAKLVLEKSKYMFE